MTGASGRAGHGAFPGLAAQLAFPAITDWDAAYSNVRAVKDVQAWLDRAARAAARFGAGYEGRLEKDLAYGSHPRERLDIFHPLGRAQGTLAFIHGGYWRSQTSQTHWHFAQGALQRGWRVAFVEYPLCPEVGIGQIALSIRRALRRIVRQTPVEPLIIAGHSAGGHLATWAGCEPAGTDREVLARVRKIVSLSGVHDLRPLVAAQELNRDLRLDPWQAQALSPALARPAGGFELTCIAGAAELPEFRRQNLVLASLWAGLGLRTQAVEIAGAHHFTLLDGLCDPDSAVTTLMF